MQADILIIDDEENLRTAAVKILAKEGHRVSTFATPHQALAKLASEGADLLLTDLMLPDFDGIEVIKRAKEIRPTVEVIVLTAYATVDKAVESMRLARISHDRIEQRSGESVRRLDITQPNDNATRRFFCDRL
jgi:DNA-binding NtrC family response regulator